jgi:hypothetical protein
MTSASKTASLAANSMLNYQTFLSKITEIKVAKIIIFNNRSFLWNLVGKVHLLEKPDFVGVTGFLDWVSNPLILLERKKLWKIDAPDWGENVWERILTSQKLLQY